ncbi:MAG: hypothetical protein ACLFN8_01855 [Candidatus Woesearchaeota archaeon]
MKKSLGVFFSLFFLFSSISFVSAVVADPCEDYDNFISDNSSCVFVCPLEPAEGRILVDLEGELLRADQTVDSASGSIIPVSIPAGDYEVTLVSFDGYSGRSSANQNKEEFYVKLLNDGGVVSASNHISDLVDGVDYTSLVEVVNNNLSVFRDVDAIQTIHSHHKQSNPQSVKTGCVAFDLIEDNDYCEASGEGVVVVDFDKTRLRVDTGVSGAIKGPFNTLIPEGLYDVTLVSSDGYYNRRFVNQLLEEWFVSFENNGDLIASSNMISDVPDGVDYASVVETVDENLLLTSSVDEVYLNHAHFDSNYVSAESVDAECMILRELEPLSCVDAIKQGYLTGSINNQGVAVIQNNAPFDYDVGLAVYEKFDEVFVNQELFDFNDSIILANNNLSLSVDLPSCNYQIDLYCGSVINNFSEEGLYNDRKIAWRHIDNGGYCVDEPDPFCGDGIINQEFEECDGDEGLIDNFYCSDNCKLLPLEPSCPLSEDDFDFIFDFENFKLRSDENQNSKSPILPMNVSDGNYSITLVAHDAYFGRVDVFQPHEQYNLEFLNGQNIVASTNMSSDLDDYVAYDLLVEEVESSFFLSGVDGVRAHHPYHPNYSSANSVNAVCAGLNFIEPDPFCGDGIINQDDELCDAGDLNGVVCSPEYGETCSYCSSTCQIETVPGPFCGDGIWQPQYEECEGNQGDFDSETQFCSDYCVVEDKPVCVSLFYESPVFNNLTSNWIDTESRIKLINDCVDIQTEYVLMEVDPIFCLDVNSCNYRIAEADWSNYTAPLSLEGFDEGCYLTAYRYTVDGVQGYPYNMSCTFYDKTVPTINKTYSGPFVSDLILDNESNKSIEVKWINNLSSVNLLVEDLGFYPSGLNYSKYRFSVVSEDYCFNQNTSNISGSGEWIYPSSLDNFSFQINGDACYLLEIMAVDNVNKSYIHKQLVFVDSTGSKPVKSVHEPSEVWLGNNSEYYLGEGNINASEFCLTPNACFDITTLTPITLACEDPSPNPVGFDYLSFKVEINASTNISEEKLTEEFCVKYGGSFNDVSGYCDVSGFISDFYFEELGEFKLDYHCTDRLGNVGESDVELFRISDGDFTITLNEKWNLISFPFVLENNSISEVFSNISGLMSVWTYYNNTWYGFNPDIPSHLNTLHFIEPGFGYFVQMNDSASLVVEGNSFISLSSYPSRILDNGWNLVGIYGLGDNLVTGPIEKPVFSIVSTSNSFEYEGPGSTFGKIAECALFSVKTSISDIAANSVLGYWEPYNFLYSNPWISVDSWSEYMYAGAGYWISTNHGGAEYKPSQSCAFI